VIFIVHIGENGLHVANLIQIFLRGMNPKILFRMSRHQWVNAHVLNAMQPINRGATNRAVCQGNCALNIMNNKAE
jgi:hypothetical protein